jgi:hypothetical protein
MPKTIMPDEYHVTFRNELVEVLRKHELLSPVEMLAVAAQFVGQLMAFQDQRVYTTEALMEMIQANIKSGNASAIQATLDGADTSKRN